MQLEIDFEAGLTKLHPTLMDMVRSIASNCGRPMKAIAADLDMSTSELSRRLAENPDDPRRFNVRDLSKFIDATGTRGHDAIHWLIEKHLEDPKTRRERATDMLQEMAPLFMALMQEALPEVAERADRMRSVK